MSDKRIGLGWSFASEDEAREGRAYLDAVLARAPGPEQRPPAPVSMPHQIVLALVDKALALLRAGADRGDACALLVVVSGFLRKAGGGR